MKAARVPATARIAVPLVAAALVAAGCSSDNGRATGNAADTKPAAPSAGSSTGPGNGTGGADSTPGTGTASGQPDPAAPPAPATAAPRGAADPALKDFYAQKPTWKPCPADPIQRGADRGLQCARLRVPLDYADPAAKTTEIAVYRMPATGPASARIGSLATNPGGPGSGVRDTVVNLADSKPTLAARYDIVGFDPRGTGDSTPVVCADGPLMDRLQSIDPTPRDAAAVDAAAAVLKDFGRSCAARMGDLLPHLGTSEAADDMDILRGVLGDERLNYIGTSYGTYLGARYADRHPDRVGRFVLDGLLDPASDRTALAREQAQGFDAAFRAFAADCIGRAGCPFTGDADAAARQMRAMLDKLSDTPARAGGRTLDEAMASTVVCGYLYHPAQWPRLRTLVAALARGDAAPMIGAFDSYADRGDDGAYADSSLDGYFEINCADGRFLSAQEAARLGREITATAPVLGPSVVWSWAADCAAPGPDLATPLDGTRLPGMLLVSTTRDPATPHVAAPRVRGQLPASRLVTYNGDGHVAIYRQNACVDRAVDRHLLDGTLPGADVRCA
ncbi:alpha/beta hydrolase [Streptodolium elevatio]|uniref:Alpha/beta hydrolase n=1 Tax=Streptodolium elevatio TaxID=3157996 RepID=A0ABV3DPU2_9ACTN